MTAGGPKFARSVRLDASDEFSFAEPARPDEWAVSGAFAFADADTESLDSKQRLAFAHGFLGLETFGRSTFVTVATVTEADLAELVDRLAAHFVARYGAPDIAAARPVAEDEVSFMCELCAEHPTGRLLAVERDFGPDGVIERFRVVQPPDPMAHGRIWDIVAEDLPQTSTSVYMTDFWASSGIHLLSRDAAGRLSLSDDFLRAYFQRPEMRPVEESNEAEWTLHEALVADPRRPVGAAELDAIGDADASENYRIVLAFRDRLVESGTLEAGYRGLFADGGVPVPPLFVDQLVHVILRNILDGVSNPLQARAGELFFRAQRVTIQDGRIMAADEETVEMYAESGGFGDLGRLPVDSEAAMREVTLDVLEEANADIYWARSDRFDTVLDLTFARPGLDALCRVMERWIRHFLDLEVRIHPVQSISDERWVWHTGLDVESSALLNDLYNGKEVEEARLGRLLSLFRLEIKDQQAMLEDVRGRPVYLGLAMDAQGALRLKPQNLLVNLPLRRIS